MGASNRSFDSGPIRAQRAALNAGDKKASSCLPREPTRGLNPKVGIRVVEHDRALRSHQMHYRRSEPRIESKAASELHELHSSRFVNLAESKPIPSVLPLFHPRVL